MQIKFSDSAATTLDVLDVKGYSVNFQGAQRDCLEIQFAKSTISFDALDALTSSQVNMAKLITIDGSNQYVHDNYCLRVSLGLKPVTTASGTEDRWCVVLAQKTYAEIKDEQQSQDIAALQSAQVMTQVYLTLKGGTK